ncbi:MAG: 3-hydroxyacyl-CoA dehydrogenase NAD-binding domain-containing protein [Planctomycetota bacterium]|nr:3-hydroxyacyl-CoA dehydrogenase NAD-binding domain-containing protein [Planctomycetota bacterium]
MTSSETLLQGNAMSEPEASLHIAALIGENHRRNHARFRIDEARPVERVGIVGAGVMGGVVAASAIGYGIPVVITDQNPAALADVKREIPKRMPMEGLAALTDLDERVARLVSVTPDLAEVAACDLVVESIVENVTTKRNFYSDLEQLCPDETLIVSNTSTLPIAELAAHLRLPQRFGGLHYFPPIGARKMFEIIPSDKTTDNATARLIQFAERIGRIPIVVADGRGFVVNRILMAYMNAGIRLLMQGVGIKAIDSAGLAFGMRLGPIRLYDEVGLDVAMQCGWSFSADSETLVARTPIIVRMMKAKQLGRKAGRGFYIYEAADNGEQVGDVNAKAVQIIEPQIESRIDLSPAEIEAAVILPMVIEATKLLETKRASSAGQLDLAVMCGIGFATSRGGPLYWADRVGADRIVDALKSLEHLGPHLCPTHSLLDAAKHGLRFYDRNNDNGGDPRAEPSSAVRITP